MAIATVDQFKAQLAFTDDVSFDDDVLLEPKLDAAQSHIERLLGWKIEETFGGTGQEPVPQPLVEAVLMLAAWWFEQRETAITGTIVAEVPYGVREIINEYREFTF